MMSCRFLTVSLITTMMALALSLSAQAQMPLSDADAPIDIAADSLEVRQQDGVAVWTGAVRVVQGEMVLESDRLDVHYGTRSQGTADESTIKMIYARGNVRVTSPNEVARGQMGIYDPLARTVTLTGQVVLTRGESKLSGEKLVVELDTGLSRLVAGGASGGRVSGTFRNAPDTTTNQ